MSDEPPVVDVATCRRPPLADRLRAALAESARALDAAESTLWVFADDGETMAAALNHGPHAAIVEAQTVPAWESVVGFVATQGTPMVIGPGDWQNPTVMRSTNVIVRAMVAVPVRSGGEVVGALSVINPAGRERFGGDDLLVAARQAAAVGALLEPA